MKTAVVHATGPISRTAKSPDEQLQELFAAVQQTQVFPDGKTFVDLVPKARAKAILKEYLLVRQDPTFNLSEFVNRHFYEFKPGSS